MRMKKFILAVLLVLPVSAPAAPEGVAPEAWSQIAPQLERASYGFEARTVGAVARNRAQDFALAADKAGLAVDGALRLRAAALNGTALPDAEPTVSDGRVEYRRGSVVEWFENRAEGLEQGFTINHQPATSDQLFLEVSFATDLAVEVAEDGRAVVLKDEQGATKYRYGGLKSFDADGRDLDSFFRLGTGAGAVGAVEIVCDVSRARFPVTIDPVLTAMAKKLLPTEGAADDWFGSAVALDGDLAVVGAPNHDDPDANVGGVYVFERHAGGSNVWGQVAVLAPPEGDGGELFGGAVGVSGDVIVVGARGDPAKGPDAGAAYVFERNLGGTNNWGRVTKLLASDGAPNDSFGFSVAVAGDVVAVGAVGDDSSRGAVYVFERNIVGVNAWQQVRKLVPTDVAAGFDFGCSVAVAGDVIVAGAYGCNTYGSLSGAAYVFERNLDGIDTWKQTRKLLPPYGEANYFFGRSVAVDGDVAVVGAYGVDDNLGAAYVFERNAGGTNAWQWVAILLDREGVAEDGLGYSVAVAGDVVVAGAAGDAGAGAVSGAAHVFERNAGGTNRWGQVQKCAAADRAAGDFFGCAVAAAEGLILVGAYLDDDIAGDNCGSAYLFPYQPEDWNGTNKLVGNIWGTYEGASLGKSVAVDGDVIVAGAEGTGVLGADSGTAFVYERNQRGTNRWGLVSILNSGNAQGINDYFGCSVAAWGDVIAVGAYGDEANGEGAGAAYVFERNQGDPNDWDKVTKLVGTGNAAMDHFGQSVAAAGDMVVVGAPLSYDTTPNRGSAYVFERNSGGANAWGQAKMLRATDASAEDHFGQSVAVAGDVVVVGAPGDDNPAVDSGSAYVFERNAVSVDNWGFVKKLAPLALDIAAGADFGAAVAAAGDLIVVGAPFGSGAEDPPGAAYVFERNAGGTNNWGQVAKLVSSDAEDGDAFGCSVAIADDLVVVGAEGDEWPGFLSMVGSAYVFGRHAGGTNAWGQMRKLVAHDPEAYDLFGHAVAAAGAVIVVGAYGDDDLIEDSGAAYVFEGTLFGPPMITAMQRSGGFSQMGFSAQPAWIYTVQWRTNLLNGIWMETDFGAFFGDVDGFSVAAHQTDSPTAVYRVRRQGY